MIIKLYFLQAQFYHYLSNQCNIPALLFCDKLSWFSGFTLATFPHWNPISQIIPNPLLQILPQPFAVHNEYSLGRNNIIQIEYSL